MARPVLSPAAHFPMPQAAHLTDPLSHCPQISATQIRMIQKWRGKAIFFLNLFSYCALIAIDATNEQSDTTVCLTLKQSTISKTRGFEINSSGLAHLDSFEDCFVESLRLPCLSKVPFKFRN